MSVIVRFAPSPTGTLHLGNIYIAIINWIFARKNNGVFILRSDDTDLQRSTEEFANSIKDDLSWMGITWDDYFKQSDNFSMYDQVRDLLINSGRLYPCYDSPDDLEVQRQVLLSQGKPPVYNRNALKLSLEDRQALESRGIKPHWRFKLDPGVVSWYDVVKGKINYDTSHISDPVLIRSDGYYLYTLTSVLDDINYGITHIIRGEDHVTNTVSQIQLFECLSNQVPHFAHLPMLVNKNRLPLSKRNMEHSFNYIKSQGWENLAIINLLTRNSIAGTAPLLGSIEQIINSFDLTKVGKSAISIDSEMIAVTNPKVLGKMSYNDVKDRLLDISPICNEDFWNAICCNISKFSDVYFWYKVVSGELEVGDISLLQSANRDVVDCSIKFLPSDNFNDTSFAEWISNIKAATGVQGYDLYRSLYLALFSQDNGPDLYSILKIMDIKVIEKYLRNY